MYVCCSPIPSLPQTIQAIQIFLYICKQKKLLLLLVLTQFCHSSSCFISFLIYTINPKKINVCSIFDVWMFIDVVKKKKTKKKPEPICTRNPTLKKNLEKHAICRVIFGESLKTTIDVFFQPVNYVLCSNEGPQISADIINAQYTVETLVMAVLAGSIFSLLVGFFTGYFCGRRCHKDEDDNLPYPDTEYEYFEQRQNVNRSEERYYIDTRTV